MNLAWLDEKGCEDARLSGNKGANLAKLLRFGYMVPQGFCIASKVSDHELKKALDRLPSPWVVRSSSSAEDSAGLAFAGIFETVLGLTTPAEVAKAIQRVMASKNSGLVKGYADQNKIDLKKINMAVVVQTMVNPTCSGVAFSQNPVSGEQTVVIEANWGLGETLVDGSVTPDYYEVNRSGKVTVSRIGAKKIKATFQSGKVRRVETSAEEQAAVTLTDQTVRKLASVVEGIARDFGRPQDVEWAIAGDQIYIVQSRPITTLNQPDAAPQFNKDDYILSFWVRGVSIFVTDIHREIYKRLEVLYIIEDGVFKQYFTKKAYQQSLERGLKFYRDEHAFDDYKKDLAAHCDKFKSFFETEITNKKSLSKETVDDFFDYTKKLCGDYTKMNFEFTDLAFLRQQSNPTIQKNLSEVAKFKDSVREVMNMVLFEPKGYCAELFKILGKQFDMPALVIEDLTQAEILDLFAGKKPDQSAVSKRRRAFAESYNLDRFYEGKDARAILQEFKEKVENSQVIRGQTASKGRAIGRVKIIPVDYGDPKRVSQEIKKMRQGDILVAETTAPELIVACRKAGAIITDMGGLMSHAAIVSRELGIPCVVGTESASKILHNGDKIEVDASQKGIINVLRRNET